MHEGFSSKRFELGRRLGAGGMGVVFEALDREQHTKVALKQLPHLRPAALLRFKNEFRALQEISHPNLVTLGELFEEQGRWFFTMELVKGVDFLSWVRRQEAPPAARGGSIHVPIAAATDDSTPTLADLVFPVLSPIAYLAPPPLDAEGRTFDEERLRDALRQLLNGLGALHSARKVHCDVKPSNIRVTPEGRVVLLDFGLVTGFGQAPASGNVPARRAVGTVQYMAPEQAASHPLGPEADLYSAGVILYEALLGCRPLVGERDFVLEAKQRFEPPSLRSVLPAIPVDLDSLCLDLMRLEPAARPTVVQALERLGQAAASEGERGGDVFVGREEELAVLHRAREAAAAGGMPVVVLEGESGVGKSALLRRFVEAEKGGALMLVGRCAERESVPFQAFDEVMDQLSRYLLAMSPEELDPLVPPGAALLARTFPVFRQIAAIAQEPPPEHMAVSVHSLRERLFTVLRELLARLAARRPLVLVIDDLQWADEDSLALLGGLMQPRVPSLFLLATVRQPWGGHHVSREGLAAILGEPCQRRLLSPLSPDESFRLALELLPAASRETATAHAVAREAAGHPLFIQELARFASLDGPGPAGVRLEDAIATEVRKLESAARVLLELIAVMGVPVAQAVIARAAGVDFAESHQHIAHLRASRLVQTTGTGRAEAVEPYHARVREAVLAGLDAARLRSCHQRLAATLADTAETDPESLALHLRCLGETPRAAELVLHAAEKGGAGLAFERAARLYRLALELHRPPESAREGELRVRLAGALVSAGQGVEGAEAYLAAAGCMEEESGLACRLKAAEHLLRAGRSERGLLLMREVLAEAGMGIPRRPGVALALLLRERAALWLRRWWWPALGKRKGVSPGARRQMDFCLSAGTSLVMVDPLLGGLFQSRFARLALASGEPRRVALALAMELGWRSVTGAPGAREVERMAAQAEWAAQAAGDPRALAACWLYLGISAFGRERWREAVEQLERADKLLRDKCVGVEYELATARVFCEYARYQLGHLGELSARVTRFVLEALARDDQYAATLLRLGGLNVAWLARDDVAEARRQVDDAARYLPVGGLSQAHFHESYARTSADLYAGDVEQAFHRAERELPRFRRHLGLNRMPILRVVQLDLWGRAMLGPGRGGPELARRLAVARRCGQRLLRERLTCAAGLGNLLLAGEAAIRGDVEAACERLHVALKALDVAECGLAAAAARWRLGELLGGEQGATMRGRARDFLEAERVKRPAALVALLAPGFSAARSV